MTGPIEPPQDPDRFAELRLIAAWVAVLAMIGIMAGIAGAFLLLVF